jgi:hypothetical protein
LGDALLGDDRDAVELARLAHQALRSRRGEEDVRRAAGTVGVAELGDSGYQHLLGRALDEHGGRLARPVSGVVGALLVEDDFVVGAGRGAFDDRERIEIVRLSPVAAEGGCAHSRVAQRVALLVDQPGVALDVALGDGDSVHRGDRADE